MSAVRNRAEHLFRRADQTPSRTAFIFENRRYSFAEVRDRIRQVAAMLIGVGFEPGSKLAVMMPTRPEFIFLEYAAFVLGGVIVPLNAQYMAGEVEQILRNCEVEFIAIDETVLERLGVNAGMFIDRIKCADVVKKVIPVGCGESFVAGLPEDAPDIVPVSCDANDTALMLHTSATTGKAKGVMLTNANLAANYDNTPQWLGLGADDVILCALPLYNTFGLNQCINACMVTGATLVLLPRFDAVACLAAIEKYRCTFFPCVPTMLQKVLDDPLAGDFDLSSIRKILAGAAPVPAPLLERVHRVMGARVDVMTGYGLTEASALVSLDHVTLDAEGKLHRPKSVGRALPGMRMIVTDEDDNEVGHGMTGEIWIRGLNIMKGYYRQPDETARAMSNGWLRTGDLGYRDISGYFYIQDRKKDLIIRGGQNIYPAEIEEVLYRHPAVAEAAVVGLPDDVMGEVPAAFVAFKPDCNADPSALMELCKTELAYFKVPKTIHIRDELPKGPTGKILRRDIRAGA